MLMTAFDVWHTVDLVAHTPHKRLVGREGLRWLPDTVGVAVSNWLLAAVAVGVTNAHKHFYTRNCQPGAHKQHDKIHPRDLT